MSRVAGPAPIPTDSDFFAQAPKLSHAKFLAFGMTKRVRAQSAANDEVLAEVVNAEHRHRLPGRQVA